MNVIVGVIVDSVNTSRKEIEDEENKENRIEPVTLETLSKQIQELKDKLDSLK